MSFEGFSGYHICPVCGKQFYIPSTTSRWVFQCKKNGKLYRTCSYTCSQKAVADESAINSEYIRHDKKIAKEIEQKEKCKKPVENFYNFNNKDRRKSSKTLHEVNQQGDETSNET